MKKKKKKKKDIGVCLHSLGGYYWKSMQKLKGKGWFGGDGDGGGGDYSGVYMSGLCASIHCFYLFLMIFCFVFFQVSILLPFFCSH